MTGAGRAVLALLLCAAYIAVSWTLMTDTTGLTGPDVQLEEAAP